MDERIRDLLKDLDQYIKENWVAPVNEDIERGYIEIANRRGIIEQFPLTSISIAVVVAEKGRFANILEIGDVAAQVKHKVKNIIGSSYIINKRK